MPENPRRCIAALDSLAEAAPYAPFDLLGRCRLIASEQPPIPLPAPPMLPPADEPTPAILEVHAAATEARYLANATATVVITIGSIINHGLWLLWITLGMMGRAIAVMICAPDKRPYRDALKLAREEHDKLLTSYRNECGSDAFNLRLRELDELKSHYQTALLKAIDRERMTSRKHHLESHLLAFATIPGIGTSRRQILEEFGITSAAHIDKHQIDRIPGFGPELAERLFEWSKEVEGTFEFSPSDVTLDSIIHSLDGLLGAGMREQIESILTDGPRILRELRESSHERRAPFHERLSKTAKEVAQRQMEYNLVK